MAARYVALLGAVLLLATGAISQPIEICARTIVVTEIWDPNGTVLPAGITPSDPNDMSAYIGHSLGFTDPMVFGGSGNSSRQAGTVKSVCYYMAVSADGRLDNYCQTTLVFGTYGQITFSGPYPDFTGSDFSNAISGGTGIFTGASGTVQVQVRTGGELWKYMVRLIQRPSCP